MAPQTTTLRHFIEAPPLKGARPSKRRPLQPPYPNAPAWKCSVYYYWWEYLRRHAGYRACCERGGSGRYAALYADFGDVHASDDFWSWWRGHMDLFAEPRARKVSVATHTLKAASEDVILVAVPKENSAALNVRQFRRLLAELGGRKKPNRRKAVSRARYPVAGKALLPALHAHLLVWDAKLAHPSATDAELADIAGIAINRVVDGETLETRRSMGLNTQKIERALHRRKQLAVQRHLRIAEQYIENVGRGQFPLRVGR